MAMLLQGTPENAHGRPTDAFILLKKQGTLQIWWPQDSKLINLDLANHLGVQEPTQFLDIVASSDEVYVLDGQNRLYSVLERRMIFQFPFVNTLGVDLHTDLKNSLLWLLESNGRLYSYDTSTKSTAQSLSSLEIKSSSPCAVGQDGSGRLWVGQINGTLIQRDTSPVKSKLNNASAIDYESNPTLSPESSGLILSSSGALYRWGGGLISIQPIWPEIDNPTAVDLEFSQNNDGVYYILEKHGSIFCSLGGGITFNLPEPSATTYESFAVMDGEQLLKSWVHSFPAVSIRIEPEVFDVPYWKPSLKFRVLCEQALDLNEIYCLIEFNPEVLSYKGISGGELFEHTERRKIFLSDFREEPQEGILEVRGVSLHQRSGYGMTGTGSLFEVEMEIRGAGSSILNILKFEAFSPSLIGQPVQLSGLKQALVNIYSTQPTIYLNTRPFPAQHKQEKEIVPQNKSQIIEGEQMEVYLQVQHVKGLKGVSYDLSFDANMLELISVEEGPFLASPGQPVLMLQDKADIDGGMGRLIDQGIVILGQDPGARGGGGIARYLFEGVRPGLATIRLDKAILVNDNREKIPLNMSSSQVEIEILEQP